MWDAHSALSGVAHGHASDAVQGEHTGEHSEDDPEYSSTAKTLGCRARCAGIRGLESYGVSAIVGRVLLSWLHWYGSLDGLVAHHYVVYFTWVLTAMLNIPWTEEGIIISWWYRLELNQHTTGGRVGHVAQIVLRETVTNNLAVLCAWCRRAVYLVLTVLLVLRRLITPHLKGDTVLQVVLPRLWQAVVVGITADIGVVLMPLVIGELIISFGAQVVESERVSCSANWDMIL